MSTFIIDIDGTICDAPQKPDGSYDYPNAVPITPTIERINFLYDEGHKIILFTARGNRTFRGHLQSIEDHHGPILKEWMTATVLSATRYAQASPGVKILYTLTIAIFL